MGFCGFSKVVLWFNEAAVQDGLKDLASVLVEDIKEAGQGTRGLTAPEQFRGVKGFCLLHRSLLPSATVLRGKFGYLNL